MHAEQADDRRHHVVERDHDVRYEREHLRERTYDRQQHRVHHGRDDLKEIAHDRDDVFKRARLFKDGQEHLTKCLHGTRALLDGRHERVDRGDGLLNFVLQLRERITVRLRLCQIVGSNGDVGIRFRLGLFNIKRLGCFDRLGAARAEFLNRCI